MILAHFALLTNGPVPTNIGLTEPILNPAVPLQPPTYKPSRFRGPGADIVTEARGAGPKRVYLDIQSQPPNVAYPPRPVPGSVADLDHVMKHCDFSKGKVRIHISKCRAVNFTEHYM
jgi:WD repeat and SOF domain-containing protein 1